MLPAMPPLLTTLVEIVTGWLEDACCGLMLRYFSFNSGEVRRAGDGPPVEPSSDGAGGGVGGATGGTGAGGTGVGVPEAKTAPVRSDKVGVGDVVMVTVTHSPE